MTSPAVAPLLASAGDVLGPDQLVPALLVLALVVATVLRRLLRGRRDRRRRTGHGRAPAARTGRGPQVGEIWWADVPFEDGAGSKDRPCLVVDSHGYRRQVLMVSSQDKSGRPGWLPVPRAGWGRDGTSWLRVDRRVALDQTAFRRLAGPCPPATWAQVAAASSRPEGGRSGVGWVPG